MSFVDPHSSRLPTLATDPDWWRGAVIYQIYPRSFQDSNGDGIGDLAGIIHRLPHVAELGVDAIWISPFFRSPMLDFGYDVSDYRDVDPMFGTLGDFDALINRAHELGLRVLIDLVLSHTSSQHPWFAQSRSSRDNPKADWYVWADSKPEGSPPNNWLSIFGGSAWEWDSERMQYYLHNFLADQPDLNFHCPEVQEELLDIASFWLERGVDGFRLDTVNFYFHDKKLRDNPPLDPSLQNDNTAPAVNPYNFQDHLYDKTQPENLQFLERLRALVDSYPDRACVGEVGESQRGSAVQAEYTSGGDKLHMCYDFDFLSGQEPTGTFFARVLEKANEALIDGWACWAYSNHDVVRHPTRWNLTEPASRILTAILLSVRGSVCLYQGEELGLDEAYVAFDELQDPYGKRFWPKYKGRDGCRTPIPWAHDSQHGGFTDGKPWLPVAMEQLQRAVDLQSSGDDTVLDFYKRMIAFRKAHPILAKGTLEIVEARNNVLSFVRAHEGERMFCAFNISDTGMNFEKPAGTWNADCRSPFGSDGDDLPDRLPPWEAVFAVENGL
ncbi:alpha-glucosidase family protein [Notoacmeibacter ruber]|uniref:DUF3459 domain-containing protein n=1 Tax=Notoacmeibacter ruber TaxID=2670375 RepID=A0A3L7JKJ9_9HYPH|nr:alpha-glucosidase family protein [Notoacmeibacter ruber]RLQ89042.1 DUF3459 domain-containing protein [Notoacmeibacter ruber]